MNTNTNRSPMFHVLTDEEKAVAEAWMVNLGPSLADIIQNAMLAALRQHSGEQIETVVQGLDLKFADVSAIMRTDPISKPVDEQVLNLVGEFDAAKWAKQFKRLFPNTDEGLMLGWFANAIMAGYDHGQQQARAMTAEVHGEREVWVQAYAAILPQCGVGSSDAAKFADAAVKAFRERYK